MDKTKNTKKNYGTAYFATAFLAAFFFEFYWIMTDPTDYFMLLGTGFIMIIMGYLTIDSLLKAKADNDAIKNEQNEMMLKAQKAIYIATKKNSKDSAVRQAQTVKAMELMMNKMISSQQALLEEKNGDDINSLIDKLSASNTKLAKEVQSALTVNQLVKANADLVKNVKEALSANAMSLEETMNLGAYVNDAVGTPEPQPVAPVEPATPIEPVAPTEPAITDIDLPAMDVEEAFTPDIDLPVMDEEQTFTPDIDLPVMDGEDTFAPDIDLAVMDEEQTFAPDIDLSVVKDEMMSDTLEADESSDIDSDENIVTEDIIMDTDIIEEDTIENNIVEEDIVEDDISIDDAIENDIVDDEVIVEDIIEDNVADEEILEDNEDNILETDDVDNNIIVDDEIIDDIISDVSINFEPDTMEAIENEINMAEMERSEELEAMTIPDEMTPELDEAMMEGNPEESLVDLIEEDDDAEDVEPLDVTSGDIPNRQLSDEEIAALFASL